MPRLFPTADPDHRYPRVTSARVLTALFDVLVGLRLLWPDDVLHSTPAYAAVARHFLGDVPFGVALLAVGSAMLVALYTDRWCRLPQAAALLALITWMLFAVDLARINGSQIGTLAYALVAALHGYAYAHLVEWRDQLRRTDGDRR